MISAKEAATLADNFKDKDFDRHSVAIMDMVESMAAEGKYELTYEFGEISDETRSRLMMFLSSHGYSVWMLSGSIELDWSAHGYS